MLRTETNISSISATFLFDASPKDVADGHFWTDKRAKKEKTKVKCNTGNGTDVGGIYI